MLSEVAQVLHYREMLKTTVRREIRGRYKGSFLGFLWTFLNPLLQLAVFSFVFRVMLRFTVPGYSYTVYLFTGLVPWTSFSAGLIMSTNVFVTNANLIKKIYFPRSILPLASVASNLVNMLLSMCIVFPVLWLTGSFPTVHYAYLPVIFLAQALLTFGFGLILSTLNVYFRDLQHILEVTMMAWFYVTPILYTPEQVSSPLFHIWKLNPMFPVITAYRDALLFGRRPDLYGLAYTLVFGLFLIIVGYLVFEALQRRFAEEL